MPGAHPSARRDARRALVVDDRSAIREVVAAMLAAERFHVVTGQSGEEGLALLRADTDGFDIVVTDVEMHGMSGVEMILAGLERTDPAVLFMTGLPEGAAQREAIARLGYPIITKPFGIDLFASAVRDAIAMRRPSRKAASPTRPHRDSDGARRAAVD